MQMLGKRALVTAALAAAVAGCGAGGDHQDLRAFMEEVQAKPPGRIEPVPPFEQVVRLPGEQHAQSVRAAGGVPPTGRAGRRCGRTRTGHASTWSSTPSAI